MKDKPFSLYQIVSNAVMIIWTICIILPFLLLFMSSITSESVLVADGYSFWPKAFSLESYAYIIKSGAQILRAYGVSILVTAVGTIVHVALAAMMAYPLAVKNLPGRRIMMFFVFFTMLFNGGIVPSYIMWSNTFHIKDTILAQLLPNLLLSAWNVMMIRTYFSTSIPDALYEAAEIDGATQFRIFRTIVVPLGKPILVTMGTFAGLGYWNDWTNGLYYITKNTEYYNIQNLLNQMVQNIQFPCSKLGCQYGCGCGVHTDHGDPDGYRFCGDPADHVDLPVFPEILFQGHRSWRCKGLIRSAL